MEKAAQKAQEMAIHPHFLKLGQQVSVLGGAGAGENNWTLAEAVEEYLRHQKRQNLRPRTIRCNRVKLGHFLAFATKRGLRLAKDVRREDIFAFKEQVFAQRGPRGKRLSTFYQRDMLDLTRRLFSRLVREEILSKNPTVGLILPKAIERISPNYLSLEDLRGFVSVIDLHTIYGFYDRTVFELAYSTGIRINELLNLKLEDLRLDDHMLDIREGKGGVDRVVILTPAAEAFVTFYLERVRPVLLRQNESSFLFPSSSGRCQIDKYFHKKIREYALLAGIPKKLSFHLFRRSTATHLLAAGMDIHLIQKLLGHRKLKTTGKYLEASTADLRHVILKFHPREKKNGGTATEAPP
jgi:integrase/recombinase XerD